MTTVWGAFGRVFWGVCLGFLGGVALAGGGAWAEEVALAKVYSPESDAAALGEYWMSEKYDGVRAVWDGRRLVSRRGKVFAAPAWFVRGLPSESLDGELWLGRGRFEETVSVVRRQKPHEGWREVKYMVFDAPAHAGVFRERYSVLVSLRAAGGNEYWRVVRQEAVESPAALEAALRRVLAGGGEGVMLRRVESVHRGGRSDDLLKVKPFLDDEAVVVGYRPGRGKYEGMTGALEVRRADGVVFGVGSGLSDALRKSPPAVGAVITYRYQGLTGRGVPRFPVFVRVRRAAGEAGAVE